MSIAVVIAVAVLFGAGVWLLTDRDTMRVVLGTALLGHGAVLLLVAPRASGAPPIVGPDVDPSGLADPVPQALSLTAIVIAFGITLLLLALTGVASAHDPDRDGDLTDDDGSEP